MICWRCGNELKEEDTYCKECGERANKKVQKKTSSAKHIIVIAAVLIGSVLLGTLIIVGMSQKGQKGEVSKVSSSALGESVEDYKAKCKTYTYEELAKNPKQYENEYMMFTGQVVDVAENGRQVVLRVKVTPKESSTWDNLWEDDLYVVYTQEDENEARLLKHDLIDLWGACRGEKTYKTVSSNSNTIPYIEAKIIENKGKAEPRAKGLGEDKTIAGEDRAFAHEDGAFVGEDETLSSSQLQDQTDVGLEGQISGAGVTPSAFIKKDILTIDEKNIDEMFALDEKLAKVHFGESRVEYIFGGQGKLFAKVPLWATFEEEGVFAVVTFNGSHVYGLDFTESAEEVMRKLGPTAYTSNSDESGELSIECDKAGYHLSIMFNENNDIYVILIKKNG